MRDIYYWCTGQWCEKEELEPMITWISDDYGTLLVSDEWSEEEIDEKVAYLVG
jgi:hypothetical protein